VLELTAADGERFVLKEVAKGQEVERRLARLRSEHRLLRYLDEQRVPVPAPLPADDGETYVREPARGATIYTLHRMLPNWRSDPPRAGETRVPQWNVPETWTNVGAAIGRLHRALAAYPGEIVSWHMVLPERIRENALPQTRGDLVGLDGERLAQLDAVFDAATTDEVCARLADLPEQHIHGDCHGGNILVSDFEVSGFIDLDHLPLGAKVYDLFYLLADRHKWRVHDPAGLEAMLPLFPRVAEGYLTENTLTARERQTLWPGMLATQLFFVQVFARQRNVEHLALNLNALTWLHQHRDELERLLAV
jgi:Ser/Thr protein kinase RdoA (MazF antagonist)